MMWGGPTKVAGEDLEMRVDDVVHWVEFGSSVLRPFQQLPTLWPVALYPAHLAASLSAARECTH